ncbi:MAG: sulfite exporter TauE/SafE family protein [Propionibacteriaceae bacterium]|nr:sulfite exporter TauE/SafE family protein [Propionibacteriaceae bacterium]
MATAVQRIVPIQGMTCKACETRVGKALRKLPGVLSATVSAPKARAVIESDGALDMAAVEQAVARCGYTIGEDSRAWVSRDRQVWRDVALGAGVAVAAVLAWSMLGLDRFGASVSQGAANGNLLLVVLLGVAASLSTCMALVGGIVMGLSARYTQTRPQADGRAVVRPQIAFNLGRIAGFALLGAGVGALGQVVALQGVWLGAALLAVTVAMGLLGIKLTGVSPRLSASTLTLPASWTAWMHKADDAESLGASRHTDASPNSGAPGNAADQAPPSPKAATTTSARPVGIPYHDAQAVALGAASFFLPCGFTQAVQVYALSTADPLRAALVMGLFAVGTTPGLMAVGLLGGLANRAKRAFHFIGVAVLGFALVNAVAGIGLLFPNLGQTAAPAATQRTSNVTDVDGVQQVATRVGFFGYDPQVTVVYANQPVHWLLNVESLGCASVIDGTSLGFDHSIDLAMGGNAVDFTLPRAGTYAYSCAMGMYTGSFTAIEKE